MLKLCSFDTFHEMQIAVGMGEHFILTKDLFPSIIHGRVSALYFRKPILNMVNVIHYKKQDYL